MASKNMMVLAESILVPSIIMLLDDAPKILLVEGPEDKRVYQSLFRSVRVEAAKGKQSIVASLRKLEAKQKYNGRCMALIDRDYDFLTHREILSDQIIYIDAHSLETLMWMTDAEEDMLPRIVNEIIDYSTIYDVQQQIELIYAAAYKIAYWVGLIRLANDRYGWNIDFKSYHLQKEMFITDTDELDVKIFLHQLLADTNIEKSESEILEIVLDLNNQECSKWEIMQGHDISAAFIYLVKQKCKFYPPEWDGWNDPEDAMSDFESRTRTACNIEKLKNAKFYSSVQKWVFS